MRFSKIFLLTKTLHKICQKCSFDHTLGNEVVEKYLIFCVLLKDKGIYNIQSKLFLSHTIPKIIKNNIEIEIKLTHLTTV